MMKNLMVLLAATFLLNAGAAESIAITATPRYPWNGKVDLEFTILGESGTKYDTSFVAKDLVAGTNLTMKALYRADGTAVNVMGEPLLPGTYRWVWNATSDLGVGFVGEGIVVEGAAEGPQVAVQLWENGPYWARCNVGATRSDETGYYFWWGDTVGCKRVEDRWDAADGSQTGFSFQSENCQTFGKDVLQLQSAGCVDATGRLATNWDAATTYWGAPWRMPTDAEFAALVSNCITTWAYRNGVFGQLVTGKGLYASRSIFLPAAGAGDGLPLYGFGTNGGYWSSTPSSGDNFYPMSPSSFALGLTFSSEYFHRAHVWRFSGQSVRPVRESARPAATGKSVAFALDLTEGSRVSTGTEKLTFSNHWDGDETTTVTIAQNGTPIFSGLTGDGVKLWSVEWNGRYELTHATYANGIKRKVETALFVVEGRRPPEEKRLLEIFAGIGDVTPSADGWRVTLTEDVLPSALKIDDDLGSVTLDLNGHNIVGATGAAGDDVNVSGGGGGSAIRIVASDGEGNPTHLTIVDSHSDDTDDVVGGCGGNGTPGGNGGAGVKVEKSARPGVEINIGVSVGIRGGDGGNDLSGKAHGGNAGAGVDGDVGTNNGSVLAGECTESINITATSRYPWNGKVDLRFTITGESGTRYNVSFAAKDLVGNTNLTMKTVRRSDGSAVNATNERLLPGTYNWVWDAHSDLGADFICKRVVVEGTSGLGGVQLWENGPYWAECNVGATKPEESGYYFWWGDTVGYRREGDRWDAVDGSAVGFSFITENCRSICGKRLTLLQSEGSIDSTSNLVDKLDAAAVHLGGPWRMPTVAELDALVRTCTTAKTFVNGVNGRLVTGLGDFSSKSIFIPVAGYGQGTSCVAFNSAGYYWSSATDEPYCYTATCLSILNALTSENFFLSSKPSCFGLPVRPVREPVVGGFVETTGLSNEFSLDCRTRDRPAGDVEDLSYSSRWNGDENATVTIAQNGTVLFDGLTGEGVKTWSVERCGRYELTHTTYTNGVKGKVETAVFVVGVPVGELTIGWGAESLVYDGRPKTPDVDVKFGDKTLEKDTHYTVTYLDNVSDGTARVIVAGLDPYFGSVTNTFEITVPPWEVRSVMAKQRYPWNGLVDVVVTLIGAPNDLAKRECVFALASKENTAAIPVEHITRNGEDVGSGITWTRRYVWDAAADVGAVKIDAVVLTAATEILFGGVQLWENGPYWAECNVGATKPEESGYYFWWGDTVGCMRNASDDGWVSVKDASLVEFLETNCLTFNMDDSQLLSAGYIDSAGNLAAEHDAATAHLGVQWRIPTEAEVEDLIKNCMMVWTTRNGVAGRLVTGKGDYSSKSIFLPAVGNGVGSGLRGAGSFGSYWSSTPLPRFPNCAYDLYFSLSDVCYGSEYRSTGHTVRPLREFANSAVTACSTKISLDLTEGERVAQATETLCYSAVWASDDPEAIVEISVNGVVIKSATGEGTVDWSPMRGGTYMLTHVVKVGAAAVGETLTAKFSIPGLEHVVSLTGRVAIVDGKYVAEVSGTDAECQCTVRYALSPEGPFVDVLPSDGEIASEFWYEVSADGYLPVTNRVEVGEIAAGAFYGRQDLTRVVIPATVTNIGHHAFACCSNLVSVTMGDSVAAVGRYAFAGCPKTVDFDLPTGVSVENLPKDGSLNQVTAVAAAVHPAWTEDIWDGYVDIDYTVAGAAISGVAAVTVKIVAKDGVATCPVTTVKGDVSASAGAHHLVWDAVADLGEARPKNLSVCVTLEPKDGSDEVIAPLEGDYAADLSLVSFRTTFGSRTSHAATIDLAKAVPLRYEVASDGSAVITAGAYTADGRILLPETLDGHAISGIRDGAFPTIAGGATFVLPDSTTAFDTATAVKWAGLKGVTTSIVFPTGVTAFQVAAFRQFQNLTKVVFNGKPDALSDSLLAYLKTSGLEIVYPEEFDSEWEAALARYVTAGVIVLSAAPRTDDPTVMDVTYRIGGTVNPVRARTLAFKDNVRSFANVVRPETFADGTEAELGEGMAPDVVHKFSWKVAADWQINLAKVRMEVLILPDDSLPLKFFTIPANGGHSAITVSRNALTEQRVLDALLWLYADGDRDLTLVDGVLRCGETVLAEGTVPNGRAAVEYVFSKMGCRVMTDEELKYVNEVSRLGLRPEGVRQYAVKVEGE